MRSWALHPSLFTKTARRRNSRGVCSTGGAQFSTDTRSAKMRQKVAPPLRSSACSCFPASTSLSTRTGTAPSRAQPRVIAAPIPLAPPVMRTTLSLSCKSMPNRFQAVKPDGVVSKDFLFFVLPMPIQIIFNNPLHLPVAARRQAHRPIGTEHQALRPELAENHVQLSLEILAPPLTPTTLGHNTLQ